MEQRRWERYPVHVSAELTVEAPAPFPGTTRLAGKLVDLSRGGARIELEAVPWLETGQEAVLALSHPLYAEPLRLVVRVAWREKQRVGLEFIRVQRPASKGIKRPEQVHELYRRLAFGSKGG